LLRPTAGLPPCPTGPCLLLRCRLRDSRYFRHPPVNCCLPGCTLTGPRRSTEPQGRPSVCPCISLYPKTFSYLILLQLSADEVHSLKGFFLRKAVLLLSEFNGAH